MMKPTIYEMEHLFNEDMLPDLQNAEVIIATPQCALSLLQAFPLSIDVFCWTALNNPSFRFFISNRTKSERRPEHGAHRRKNFKTRQRKTQRNRNTASLTGYVLSTQDCVLHR